MQQPTSLLHILIVEDHPMMATAMQVCLLAMHPRARIGLACSLRQAQDMVASFGAPPLVITDLQLPDSDGLATLAAVQFLAPQANVVVFSASANPAMAEGALSMGAARVLDKSAFAQDFAEELRPWLGHLAALADLGALAQEETAAAQADSSTGHALLDALTARQRDVLAQVAEGYSNRAIGENLNIGGPTVNTHVSEILRRLGVQNRTQASALYYAWNHGRRHDG